MKHVQDLNQELIVTKLNLHTPMLLQAKYYSISISSLQYVLTIGPHRSYGLPLCMFESTYHNDDTCHYNSISIIGSLTFTHLVHVKFSVRMGWTSQNLESSFVRALYLHITVMHHAIAFSHLVLAERYFFKLFPLDYINPGLLLCTSLNNNFTKQLHVKYHCISIADA